MTSDGNNYATQAADLAALLDHLSVENPVIAGWSAGSLTAWHHVRNRGTDGIRALVSVDMPPLGMSYERSDWVEGAISDLAGFFQGVQTAQGQRGIVTWYADNVMIEGDMTPEVTAWVVEQSLATPPLIAANLIADVCFANYLDEAKQVDAAIPSLFFVADHWAETAKPFLAKHCPNSRVEAFGGHMMFWEYPERFNGVSCGVPFRPLTPIGTLFQRVCEGSALDDGDVGDPPPLAPLQPSGNILRLVVRDGDGGPVHGERRREQVRVQDSVEATLHLANGCGLHAAAAADEKCRRPVAEGIAAHPVGLRQRDREAAGRCGDIEAAMLLAEAAAAVAWGKRGIVLHLECDTDRAAMAGTFKGLRHLIPPLVITTPSHRPATLRLRSLAQAPPKAGTSRRRAGSGAIPASPGSCRDASMTASASSGTRTVVVASSTMAGPAIWAPGGRSLPR